MKVVNPKTCDRSCTGLLIFSYLYVLSSFHNLCGSNLLISYLNIYLGLLFQGQDTDHVKITFQILVKQALLCLLH